MNKKMVLRSLLAVLTLAIPAFWIFYLLPSLRIATGYTAKYVCSSTFIGRQAPERIEANLAFFPVDKVKYEIDTDARTVETSLFGLAKRKAFYYEVGPSCSCVLGESETLAAWASRYPHVVSHPSADSLIWPLGSRSPDSIPSGVDIDRLRSIVSAEIGGNPAILAITVAYRDQLIAEAYGGGIDKDTPILGWSMTKTIANALLGIMVKNGQISLDDPASFSIWEKDERKTITVDHLLQMSSGLRWREDYESLSSVTRMLYLEKEVCDYAIRRPLDEKPGSHWLYSSGTTNILSRLIRSKWNDDYANVTFPYDSLFRVIGMSSAVIELDGAGNPVYSSYGWATARDWTRFGLLFLHQGDWFGRRVFTPEWAKYSVTPAPASNGIYGAQIWLNVSLEKMPGVPPDAYYENGFGGQRVLVLPSRDLVVVLLSGKQKDYDFDSFYARLLACFQAEK